MEKADDKRDSGLENGRPPSYSEQAPRQEPPPDLSARLANLNLNSITGVGHRLDLVSYGRSYA